MAIEYDDSGLRSRWNKVAAEAYSGVLEADPTVGRLYHHLAILARPKYLARFCGFLKSINVATPFFLSWESIFTVTRHFVAPGKAASEATRDEVLSIEEDRLFTAVSFLVLASEDPNILDIEGYNSRKETHLQGFDAALRELAGLGDEEPTSESSGRGDVSRASGAILDWDPARVGPATHYAASSRYISGKAVAEAPANTSRQQQGYGKKTAATASPRKAGPAATFDDGLAQSFALHPRYVFATHSACPNLHTNARVVAPSSRSCCSSFCSRCPLTPARRLP